MTAFVMIVLWVFVAVAFYFLNIGPMDEEAKRRLAYWADFGHKYPGLRLVWPFGLIGFDRCPDKSQIRPDIAIPGRQSLSLQIVDDRFPQMPRPEIAVAEVIIDRGVLNSLID